MKKKDLKCNYIHKNPKQKAQKHSQGPRQSHITYFFQKNQEISNKKIIIVENLNITNNIISNS